MEKQVNWEKGLIPAIVQHWQTGVVQMLGYMNKDALDETKKRGCVCFFSRSKNRLWVKGETSGNKLEVKEIHLDCDRDTILIKANPIGPTCHTGAQTCFHTDTPPLLVELEETISNRIASKNKESYVAKLAEKGLDKIAQKVGEEGVEVALAAVSSKQTKEDLTNEAADLLFHLMVLLKHEGLSFQKVVDVLQERQVK